MLAGVYQGGQFPMLPMTGEVTDGDFADMGYPHPVPAYASLASVATQQAEPGYYAATLIEPDMPRPSTTLTSSRSRVFIVT